MSTFTVYQLVHFFVCKTGMLARPVTLSLPPVGDQAAKKHQESKRTAIAAHERAGRSSMSKSINLAMAFSTAGVIFHFWICEKKRQEILKSRKHTLRVQHTGVQQKIFYREQTPIK